MNKSFAEHQAVRSTEPLRQGDVLESVDLRASMWTRHLLVITADCDFAHGKNQGRVTCVPLLDANEYLLEMQVPRQREKLVRRPVAEVREMSLRIAGADISEKRLRQWVQEDSPNAVVAALKFTGTDRERALARLNAIRLLDSQPLSLDSALRNLVEATLAISPTTKRESALAKVIEPFRQTYSQPPGDALFLSSIAESCDTGYFAYLRHMEHVPEATISLGPARQEVGYRRISRLADRYSHALVQRFAMVFLSIGLPQEYEELRDLHAEYIGEELT